MPPVLDTVGAAVASANNVATPTTLTPVLPAHSAGKLLLAATFCRSGTPTVATPAGWVQLANVVGTNGRIALFGKIAASGSESNPAIVWSGLTTGTTGSPVQAQCAVFSGALETLTGIVDILGAVENGAAATATAASGAAISTIEANDLVLSLSCRLDDVGTWTPPAGFTAVGSALTTSGSDMSFAWAYQVKTTPGSVAPADFGLAGASSFASTGVMIALKQHVPVTYFGAISRPITFGATTKGDKPAIVQKMATFQDDFSTPPDAPNWNDGFSYGWNGSALVIDCIPAFGYISTWDGAIAGVYDLIGSYIYAKITPPAIGNGTKETYLEVSSVGTSGPTRDGVSFEITGLNLTAFKKIDGVIVDQATPRTYDPINDQWLRIREQSSTIYCDTSPDGINWTNFWSTPLNFNVSQCWAAFTCGYSGTEGASSAIVDDINIPQVPAGPTTHYGITSTSLVFNRAVQGRRQTFSQITAPFIFSKEVQGRRKTFGQVAFPIMLVKEVQAQRKTFGQLQSPLIFGKTVVGQRKTFGQVALPITMGFDTAGFRVGLTHYGALSLPIILGKDVRGQRKTFGQITFPIVFAKDVKGVRKTFGQIVFPIIFTKEAVGRKNVFGQLSMQTLFGKETAGSRKTFSQFAMPITFSKDVAGRRQTFGRVALPINFAAFVNGQSFVGPKTYYGQLAMSLAFNKQVTAYRKTFGQVTAPFIFGAASQGQRKTFSQLTVPMSFVIDVKTGRVGTYGQIAFPIVIDIEIDGKAFTAGVILNLADAIYLGSELAEAVYVGVEKVWPGFSPIDILGITGWYDASKLTLADGALVNPWMDLSGNNHHLISQPERITGSPPSCKIAGLNGLRVVHYTPNGDNVLNTNTFVTYGHIFVIAKFAANVFPDYNGLISGTDGSTYMLIGTAGSTAFYPPNPSMGTVVYRRNGVIDPSRTGPMNEWVVMSQSISVPWTYDLSIGLDRVYPPRYWHGDVAEVIGYNRVLSDSERQQVEAYLQKKWGV